MHWISSWKVRVPDESDGGSGVTLSLLIFWHDDLPFWLFLVTLAPLTYAVRKLHSDQSSEASSDKGCSPYPLSYCKKLSLPL